MNEQQYRDDWWKIRNILKPKLYNPASTLPLKKWTRIKKSVQNTLREKGFSEALKHAEWFINNQKLS